MKFRMFFLGLIILSTVSSAFPSEVLSIQWQSACYGGDGSDLKGFGKKAKVHLAISACALENDYQCVDLATSESFLIGAETLKPDQTLKIQLDKIKSSFPSSNGIGRIGIDLSETGWWHSDRIKSLTYIPFADIKSRGDISLDLNNESNPYRNRSATDFRFSATVEIRLGQDH